ncbi:hypothetical protein [Methanogenium cariaci]|uniref:hypothetical protein n=1 Tax=Methanogenium cariaci TaxID=2197 RepID=UPI001FDF3CD0|nr:hypothetical protein [Methanogenium cariaci]
MTRAIRYPGLSGIISIPDMDQIQDTQCEWQEKHGWCIGWGGKRGQKAGEGVEE